MNNNKKIYLYFGASTSQKLDEDIEQYAINFECSVERAHCDWFNLLISELLEVKDGDGRSKIDDFIGWHNQRFWLSPKLSYKTHLINYIQYPLLVFNDEFATHQFNDETLYINDELIYSFGNEIENDYGVEFLRFDRR
jgi:hypothetical protein